MQKIGYMSLTNIHTGNFVPCKSSNHSVTYSQYLVKSVSSVCFPLFLFVPSNSEWVASPGPSNIGAKRSKVWVGQEKPNKNAHILKVNIAVLPSLSDTISLSSSPVYWESSTHPSSESSSLCSLSKSMKSIYPMLQKLIFLWLAIVSTTARNKGLIPRSGHVKYIPHKFS